MKSRSKKGNAFISICPTRVSEVAVGDPVDGRNSFRTTRGNRSVVRPPAVPQGLAESKDVSGFHWRTLTLDAAIRERARLG